MNLFKLYILLTGLAITLASCCTGGDDGDSVSTNPPVIKPDEPQEPTYPTYDAPHWSVSNPDVYECSMTAILILPDTIVGSQQPNDELAIFMNDECRGVAERIEVSPAKYVWMVMIKGNTNESKLQKLKIRYWSSIYKYMYDSDNKPLFETDSRLGEIDAPYTLDLKIKEN